MIAIGISLDGLGGETGALRWTVEEAARIAVTGQLPFAALVALDGEVVGAGVNTAVGDLDVSAHAEVTAVRDAARRVGRCCWRVRSCTRVVSRAQSVARWRRPLE